MPDPRVPLNQLPARNRGWVSYASDPEVCQPAQASRERAGYVGTGEEIWCEYLFFKLEVQWLIWLPEPRSILTQDSRFYLE